MRGLGRGLLGRYIPKTGRAEVCQAVTEEVWVERDLVSEIES
jgi:hypothetical protein